MKLCCPLRAVSSFSHENKESLFKIFLFWSTFVHQNYAVLLWVHQIIVRMKRPAARWYFIKADEAVFVVTSVPLHQTEHAEDIWEDDSLLLEAELKLLLRTDHSLTSRPCSATFWYATMQQTAHVISSVWSIYPTDRVQLPTLITDHFMRQDIL